MHNIMDQLLRSDSVLAKHQMGTERSDMEKLVSLSAAFPPSYLEFLARYGGVKLFREGYGYLLIVLALPQQLDGGESGVLFRFGSYDDSYCYFLSSLLKASEESPVFAFDDGKLVRVAKSFSEWFTLGVRELISRQESKAGGDRTAFTEAEKRVVQLRKEYNWLVVGTTDTYVEILITNESDSTLDCITLGVRSKDHTLNGAVRVDVKGLSPGMSRKLQLDCYSDLIDSSCVELFDLPDPTPGTKSNYFELV